MDGAPGEHKEQAAILMLAASERFSAHDLAIVDEKLRRTLIRTADYRQQAGELLARNQAQSAAFRTGEHGPVGVIVFSHTACILQHEDRAGKHLFGDPLAQDVEFSNHVASWFSQTMLGQAMWSHYVEPNFLAYEACRTLRNERDILVLLFLARISARTCRTVSLRQIVSMGWRAFFRMSTICRG